MADDTTQTDESSGKPEKGDPFAKKKARQERLREIREKARLSPAQRGILALLLKREGSGLTLAVLMILLQWAMPLHVPGTLSWGTVYYVAFLGVLACSIFLWYVFCHANAVDYATREDAPVKDAQATADTGWSNCPIYAVGAMVLVSGFGWFLDGTKTFVQDPMWLFARERLIMSWPMVIFSILLLIFIFKVDLKIFGPLFQRINTLRGAKTRFEHKEE